MNKTRDQDFNNPGRCFIVSERQYNYMDLAKAAWPRMITDGREKMKDIYLLTEILEVDKVDRGTRLLIAIPIRGNTW
jgi:hypothetical protein